jgi:hypothetical protein
VILKKIVSQRLDRRIFEEQGLREFAEIMLQHLRESRDHDRVSAVILDRLVRVNLRQWQLGDLGKLANQIVNDLVWGNGSRPN